MSSLLKIIVTPLLLSPYLILIAMTAYPLFTLGCLSIFAVYAWFVIWLYADLKAQRKVGFGEQLLFVPFLVTSGSLGLMIWIVFEPEARRRRWYERH